ncbi:hypothetical protein PPL_06476 [Heterostelium album PN500]|uniref:PD-(D/E)XK endonuclease-like domain-containing protein n=1 Tax=Heterostelium pallidum (strain ATCC 26659 / Pp 5 / PN500) TaxID=670386 RepID=D3BD95_HETP5|nr:hypothetical protein PPL_06476 [Heterostelium album PN500]EFA80539.1 hypothetical protein PPL_06476 [Heterostelium album PN500]|eukprot:XP_020432659.1 hypothetical protein PPL_06476 [Heterostelium album PN500]
MKYKNLSSLLSASTDIKRVTKNGQRYYQGIPGTPNKLFPSVTTVLKMINKPMLKQWELNTVVQSLKESYFAKRPKDGFATLAQEKQWIDQLIVEAKQSPFKVMGDAASFGTKAHLAIDNSVLAPKDEVASVAELASLEREVVPVRLAFDEWKQRSGLTMELRDSIVWSERYQYAGAVDAVGRKADGTLVALDWKTSNYINNEYALQVCAYAKALEELTGEKIGEAWVVKFNKKLPLFETKFIKDIDRTFNTFVNVLELFNHYEQSDFFDESIQLTNVPRETLSAKSEEYIHFTSSHSNNTTTSQQQPTNHYISSKQQQQPTANEKLEKEGETDLLSSITQHLTSTSTSSTTESTTSTSSSATTTTTNNNSKLRFTIRNSGNPLKVNN